MERIQKLVEAIKNGKKIGPRVVMISPTDRCNLNCKTCWRMNKNQGEFERGLSLDKINEILGDCKDLGVNRIDFTGGGEPFFRDDIFEMIGIAKDYGFEISLTSNGTLLDESKIRKLVELGLDEILFSLDGLKETNDYIRGEGVFDKVIDVVEKYRKMDNNATVGFSTVLTSKNLSELSKLVKLTDGLDLDYHNFSVLNVWKSNEFLSLENMKEGQIYEQLKKSEKILEGSSVGSNLGKIIEYGVFDKKPPRFCFAPWEMAFINASGDVMVCCTLASYYKNLLGNVKEKSFRSIWNGEKIEEFREEMKKRNFQKRCRECLPDFIDEYNDIYEEMSSKYEFEGKKDL
ncbi:MAG: radical SAM protein [Candidatus Aenigmatarchaeota archaeon]